MTVQRQVHWSLLWHTRPLQRRCSSLSPLRVLASRMRRLAAKDAIESMVPSAKGGVTKCIRQPKKSDLAERVANPINLEGLEREIAQRCGVYYPLQIHMGLADVFNTQLRALAAIAQLTMAPVNYYQPIQAAC
ncbi:hypothetical protein EV127DRAFT_403754 [Xylaria flabelliformis]|nr:hypothetical protein EV127DRAFT_403754 [Xylaria flabelliformis]